MALTRLSGSGHFVVIDELHIDRSILEALAAWAEPRRLDIQDAIQLALCMFNAHRQEWIDGTRAPTAVEPEAEARSGGPSLVAGEQP